VVRSASRIGMALAGLATLPVPLLLSGCVTTQQVAARERLVDARIRASQSPLRLGRLSPYVRVTRLSLLRGSHVTVLVAQLRNTSARSVTDVPISVGIAAVGGRRVYLNHAANTDYFDTHVAAIEPHAVITWVFTSRRRLTGAGAPFAQVGVTQLPEPAVASLPRIAVAGVSVPPGKPGTLTVTVSNQSAVPQNTVPVYGVAVQGRRVLAAGRASVAHLATNGTATAHLTLLGRIRGATVRLTALPTIFQ
jgi:hypothetical protein